MIIVRGIYHLFGTHEEFRIAATHILECITPEAFISFNHTLNQFLWVHSRRH